MDIYQPISQYSTGITSGISSNLVQLKGIRQQAQNVRLSKVLGNASKTLVSVISTQITSQLSQVAIQNSKLSTLVNNTNTFIANIKTQSDIQQAIQMRNSCLNIINNNEQKLLSIAGIISQIADFTVIFGLITKILLAIPIPSAVPPGVGIPLNIITGMSNQISTITKLITGLGTILSVASVIIQILINDLEDLKNKLATINALLDQSVTSTLNNDQLNNLLVLLVPTNSFGVYRGFTFAIKTEANNPAEIVDGFQRHYAVAINSKGVVTLQSDLSFTQDSSQLVEELKTIISKMNLQG